MLGNCPLLPPFCLPRFPSLSEAPEPPPPKMGRTKQTNSTRVLWGAIQSGDAMTRGHAGGVGPVLRHRRTRAGPGRGRRSRRAWASSAVCPQLLSGARAERPYCAFPLACSLFHPQGQAQLPTRPVCVQDGAAPGMSPCALGDAPGEPRGPSGTDTSS